MSGTAHLRESQDGSYRFGFLEGTADHAAGRLVLDHALGQCLLQVGCASVGGFSVVQAESL